MDMDDGKSSDKKGREVPGGSNCITKAGRWARMARVYLGYTVCTKEQ